MAPAHTAKYSTCTISGLMNMAYMLDWSESLLKLNPIGNLWSFAKRMMRDVRFNNAES